ncbi:endonuclease/exonuclease/phosphatase family protein [Mucilaginibacter gotjawali]|uniref:Endonuclease/Exonuclease/phosphatase family protein n=2 Tax=Mucilaginibacter gotjawali TaxID=1550579 RepID=A0A110B1S9_9SPHI|nr:endonuclease/exonuclease/phosphatase family protein [Mucilaginibacter gotjawali]MBB3055570.1 exonuclease III [Mucilaginibacter gotjawali]BAU53149.1 Endonuclease/Exonuclease/phosphatase family protein [Mucilaginibacter gotjawali]
MKIITWNCNMAFRKKAAMILAHQPDILIVPECECIEKLVFGTDTQKPSDILWFGNNPHKGLAILAYHNLKLTLLDDHNPAFQMIVPISVTGGDVDFNLFAVWANNPNDKDGQYIEQVWKAIHYYNELLTPKRTVLAGDFNSNTIWDRKRRPGNHTNVVKYLEEKGIYSAYHLHHSQIQGKELHPTFHLYKHQNKPYHIDYCFVSADIAKELQSVEVGEHAYWTKYSDHVPVIVTFNTGLFR